jgi:ribosomal protein S18 acetylase RimI-like enzyme
MDIQPDPWLSGIFEHPVFRVERPADTPAAPSWVGRFREAGRAFYYAKVDAGLRDSVSSLRTLGFRIVAESRTFALRPPWRTEGETPSGLRVEEATPADEDPVCRIAAGCFRYSRFHVDPRIPRITADRIKRNWIRNYFTGARGDRLYVARRDGRAVGFLGAWILTEAGDRVGTIDLMGVDSAEQGRGVGRALVRHFIREEGPRADHLRVATQTDNGPALRLYRALGFQEVRAQCVMHLHAPEDLVPEAPCA